MPKRRSSASGRSIWPIVPAAPTFIPVSPAFFQAAHIPSSSAAQSFSPSFPAGIFPFFPMPISASVFCPAPSAFPSASSVFSMSAPAFPPGASTLPVYFPFFPPASSNFPMCSSFPPRASSIPMSSPAFPPAASSHSSSSLVHSVSSISDHCFVDSLESPASSLLPRVSSASFSRDEESSSSCVASTTKRRRKERDAQKAVSKRSRLSEYRDPPAALASPPDDTLTSSVSAPVLVCPAASVSPPASPSFSPISPPDLDSDWDLDLDSYIQSHPNQDFDSGFDSDLAFDL